MKVFELKGIPSWIDWSSRGQVESLGLFSTHGKAETHISTIKKDKNWRMDWSDFEILEVEVK